MPEPKKRAIDDYELVYPLCRADWRAWLAANHDKSPGIWLVRYKVSTKQPTITYDELVEEALCFGWIDGLARGLDAERHLQLLTPRKPKSVWSKINVDKVAALIEQGRMRPAGQAAIDLARADGRWEAAYDSQKNASVPEDLQAALDASPAAAAFYATLNGTNRYAILFRVQTAKKPETRAKRIRDFIAMLERNEKLYP